ncbi:transmembrane protein [Anaeramoeba flamelloides]|uniref:Transmembrane protein n=1 Tax=Anaeramoeba flamelloides TaxID=1746091 RepID=A0AAV8A2Z5_9EUKA|nr:transmembrane protein [Anaeramoeba flamelloides]
MFRFVYLLLFFFVFQNCSCYLYSKTKLDTPRYDLSGNRLPNRFCALNDNGNCQWRKYAESLGLMLCTGIVMSFLCIVFFFGLVLFRLTKSAAKVCGCCTKQDALKNVSVNQYKYFIIFVCVVLLVSASVGISGNVSITGGMTETFDEVLETEDTILKTAETVHEKLQNFGLDINTQAILDQAEDLKQRSVDTKETVMGYDTQRQTVSYIGFISVTLVFIIAASTTIIFKMGKIGSIISIFTLLAAAVLWLAFGAHYTVGVVINDTCYELDDEKIDDNDGPILQGYLDDIMDCTGSSVYSDFFDAINEAYDKVGDDMCGGVNQFCDEKARLTNDTMPCTMDPTTCNENNTENWKNETLPNFVGGCWEPDKPYKIQECHQTTNSECDDLGGTYQLTDSYCMEILTLQECADNCGNDEQKTGSQIFIEGLEDFDAFKEMIDEIMEIINCTAIIKTWEKITGNLCSDINGGIDQVATGAGLGGGFIVMGAFILVIGEKKLSEKGEPTIKRKKNSSDSSSTSESSDHPDIEMSDFNTVAINDGQNWQQNPNFVDTNKQPIHWDTNDQKQAEDKKKKSSGSDSASASGSSDSSDTSDSSDSSDSSRDSVSNNANDFDDFGTVKMDK